MTDIDSKVEEMQKKTKIIAREVADCVFQSFLFPSRGTPRVEKHHAPTAAIKRSRVSENQVVLSANLERSGVVVTVKATTISGALRVHHNLILILACPKL